MALSICQAEEELLALRPKVGATAEEQDEAGERVDAVSYSGGVIHHRRIDG